MVETKIWVFLALMALAGVAIPLVVRRMKQRTGEQVALALSSLRSTGHVVDEGVTQQGRPYVRVWGALDHPVALDLRVVRRGRILGRISPGPLAGLLDPGFERAYRVVTSDPERARLVLDPDVQMRLTRLATKLEFRLGSVETLLPPDYWKQESGASRRLRRLWMIRIPGRRPAGGLQEVVEAGRMLARQVAKHCLPPGAPDPSDFETKPGAAWL